MPRKHAVLSLIILMLSLPTAASASDLRVSWTELKQGNAVAIMRHALAPGIGDPDHFAIDDCTTQRNLSDRGREQAQRIGNLFRQNGISDATVLSSAWCRCLDTARLLELGDVEQVDVLNSFFRNRQLAGQQTKALIRLVREQAAGTPLILVTHQVNITALTDVFPESGEIVFFRLSDDDRIDIIGRLSTDP